MEIAWRNKSTGRFIILLIFGILGVGKNKNTEEFEQISM